MGREKQRNKKSTIILNIVLILLAITSLILIIYIKREYNYIKNENDILKDKLQNNNDKINTSNEEIKNFNNEIDILNNLDNKISTEKENYYNSIRELENKILKGESNQKIAYITIDDGPYSNTKKFLEILKSYNAPATFFVLLKPNRINEYKQMVQDGHVIANHTASHNLKRYLFFSKCFCK